MHLTSQRTSRRSKTKRAAVVVAVALVVASMAAIAAPLPAIAAVKDSDPRLPRVRAMNFTDCVPTCESGTKFSTSSAAYILRTDSARRQIYAYGELQAPNGWRAGIAVVDADRLDQTDWIDLRGTPLSAVNTWTSVVYDAVGGRMFFGQSAPSRLIAAVDLTAPDPAGTIVEVQLPALASFGTTEAETRRIAALTYDPVTQRLFVLTNTPTSTDVVLGGTDFSATVLAYETRSLNSESEPLWTHSVRPCKGFVPADFPSSGRAYFDAAQDGSFLYLPCRDQTNLAANGVQSHGVVRLNLNRNWVPGANGVTTTEFFHFPGSLSQGFSMGDPAADRVAIGVSGNRQRLYVFDAAHRAWIGSLVLPGNNAGIGPGAADVATGRMYVATADGFLYIDAAGLPPRALTDALTYGYNGKPNAFVVDPLTRRLFVPGPRVGANTLHHLWVYEDRTDPFVRVDPANPDDGTNDIDEAEAVAVTHTAAGSAFGARVLLANGVGGVPIARSLNEGIVFNNGVADAYKLEGGDRGLFLSQVARADLEGQARSGTANATAVALRIDDATQADLRAQSGELTGALQPEGQDAPPCDSEAPGPECLNFDGLAANVPDLQASRCHDFGSADDPTENAEQGSAVECRSLDRATGWASASARHPKEAGLISFSVAHSESSVEAVKLPDGGVVTTSTAVAQGITVSVPGMGTIRIGEIRSTATAHAGGRPSAPKNAHSNLESVAKNVQLVRSDADGDDIVFSCGVTGAAEADDEEQCDGAELARQIDNNFAPRLRATGPRRDMNPLVTGSPRGARAQVVKDPFAIANDATLNGDSRHEVSGLELTAYYDSADPGRAIFQFAAVYAEAQYKIGVPKPPVVTDKTKLSIALVGDDDQPLEGGVFQVRTNDALGLSGALTAACVTGDDGTGDCEFEGLPAGEYVISQTAAPAGYAPADDTAVTLVEGLRTRVTFVNLRAIGSISISLTDDGGETGTPGPLGGATFALLADDGDLVRGPGDQLVGECTTDADGECGFEELSLGGYVVTQTVAPGGYLSADDVGFRLELPGQAARLSYVTGLEGIEGTPGAPADAAGGEAAGDVSRDTAFVDEPTETTTVIIEQPPMRPVAQVSTSPLRSSGLARIIGLPADALGFLRREPQQAVLFGLIWLLLAAPVYLAVRRRTLTLAKDVM